VLAIDASKRYYVNTREVQKSELTRRIQELLETKSQKIVIIKADDDVEYGAVMEAMDSLRAVGIEDLGLITDPKRGSAAAGGGQ
jgi:biopolymer transport protein TolR